jgi:hypothetical protein
VEDRRHLDDSILHATVMRQDSPTEDDSSIYHVFERLNTGGKLLSGQEIRASLYHGGFNSLLVELNDDEGWRAIFGPINRRLRDQELILRFFALKHQGDEYERPLKGFLNRFMRRNREFAVVPRDVLEAEFRGTVGLIRDSLGDRPFRPERLLNAAILDSVMVAVSEGVDKGTLDPENVRSGYETLLGDSEFLGSTKGNTAQEEQVERRLTLARDALGI